MSDRDYKRFMPSFITLLFDLFEHFRRNKAHDNSIKRLDKTQEKLATVEHMLVRLEKKIQHNRDTIKQVSVRIQIYLIANFVVLVAVLLKVCGAY